MKKITNWLKGFVTKRKKLSVEELQLSAEERRLVQEKTGPYGLGSIDPLGKDVYCSFAGVDIRLSADGKSWAVAQGLSYHYYLDKNDKKKCAGTVIEILMGQNIAEYLGKTVHLIAMGADEYGRTWKFFDEKVKFIDYKAGISIDDIVADASYTFVLAEEEKKSDEE